MKNEVVKSYKGFNMGKVFMGGASDEHFSIFEGGVTCRN